MTDTYDCIITDPPWSYTGSTTKWGACGKEYATMADEDLLNYRYPLTKNGVLFMWATCPRLDMAVRCIEAHGLHYRGVAFVWVKTKQDGTPIGAQGVRPSIVKPLTEVVLAASYRATGRPLPLSDESIVQTVFAPRGLHSQKPEAVQDRLEAMYPTATRAEFFARRRRHGWHCFGSELETA
jgi:N6-adenosine-specific RNA methylase IME4